MKSNLVGHEKILNFFDKVIDIGNLSHAYCFVGSPQLGKYAVAKVIAAKLLGVPEDKLNTQADFIEINQGVNEKTGKTNKDVSIDQLRQCQSFLSEFAFLGGYKIVIIDPAEKMSIAASNALLKTLEEPKQKTVLFLIATDESRLPQTIRSRCQTIYFSPVPTEQIQNALVERGAEQKEAEQMARLSHGLPGQAFDWIRDRSSYELYKSEVLRFESLFSEPFYGKIKKVDELFGDKKDHIAAREKLKFVLGIWQILIRDKLFRSTGTEGYCIHEIEDKKQFTESSLLKTYSLIKNAREGLQKNIHPRLLVEQVLLSIP